MGTLRYVKTPEQVKKAREENRKKRQGGKQAN